MRKFHRDAIRVAGAAIHSQHRAASRDARSGICKGGGGESHKGKQRRPNVDAVRHHQVQSAGTEIAERGFFVERVAGCIRTANANRVRLRDAKRVSTLKMEWVRLATRTF